MHDVSVHCSNSVSVTCECVHRDVHPNNRATTVHVNTVSTRQLLQLKCRLVELKPLCRIRGVTWSDHKPPGSTRVSGHCKKCMERTVAEFNNVTDGLHGSTTGLSASPGYLKKRLQG